MTGFQANPASPFSSSGDKASPMLAEEIAESLGAKTSVLDPVEDIREAIRSVCNALQEEGLKVIVFRRSCATFDRKSSAASRGEGLRARVDPEKCIGESCGCDRFCSRVLACPAIQFDGTGGKALIGEDLCNGCGLCVQLCPSQAISLV